MDTVFEALISSYIENKIGISDNFLNKELSNNLKENLIFLNKKQLLTKAKIGNLDKKIQNSAIRKDAIFWLDKKNNNAFENQFFVQIGKKYFGVKFM